MVLNKYMFVSENFGLPTEGISSHLELVFACILELPTKQCLTLVS